MSPAKKPPRPVTAWFVTSLVSKPPGKIVPGSGGSRSPRAIRCRVTPIRPGTDAEIERLAKALYKDGTEAARTRGLIGITPFHQLTGETRERWLSVARAAWKRGAR